ncbi:ornithine carbamoyltransferase [Candidatus Pantoea edessiphila]|uniref:Ornithine carbamoyltransferase n=1 Tax=Candidatus Pantoea edessiphila TaxID=2044610 RepID=A0A2P5SY64_9GAMM|nr:ornithine carbamoyltransferase [Candidatus Pantoea edessiphila]MBK4775627.1 ornithine carbamoyltransferase [Pantoea sp. Edef]PPI87274.1 ornithine carbamoyltransferase [Candidatus Pantoea edessiphila]
MNQLHLRHFLRLLDFSSDEIKYLIKMSSILKQEKKALKEIQYLKGKNIVLIFEKESTRTRCAFEVAAYDQGANITYLNSHNTQIGYKESIKDTARVLGCMYDGIQYRGFSQKTIETIAKYSGVPVWNGLTNEFHPTQIIADLLTMQEHLLDKKLNEIKLVYVGDARNNIGNSILEAAALLGFNLRILTHKSLWPRGQFVENCLQISQKNGGQIIFTDNVNEGVNNADFIYTDVWVSMGEPQEIWDERIRLLRDYQVNSRMLELTGNSTVKFLHCLPSLHDEDTDLGLKLSKKYNFHGGIEVSKEVFESNHSIVFDQASNRLHTIKAIMVATLVKLQ